MMTVTATATLTIFDYANAEPTVEALGALAQGHADDAYRYGIERYAQGYVVRRDDNTVLFTDGVFRPR